MHHSDLLEFGIAMDLSLDTLGQSMKLASSYYGDMHHSYNTAASQSSIHTLTPNGARATNKRTKKPTLKKNYPILVQRDPQMNSLSSVIPKHNISDSVALSTPPNLTPSPPKGITQDCFSKSDNLENSGSSDNTSTNGQTDLEISCRPTTLHPTVRRGRESAAVIKSNLMPLLRQSQNKGILGLAEVASRGMTAYHRHGGPPRVTQGVTYPSGRPPMGDRPDTRHILVSSGPPQAPALSSNRLLPDRMSNQPIMCTEAQFRALVETGSSSGMGKSSPNLSPPFHRINTSANKLPQGEAYKIIEGNSEGRGTASSGELFGPDEPAQCSSSGAGACGVPFRSDHIQGNEEIIATSDKYRRPETPVSSPGNVIRLSPLNERSSGSKLRANLSQLSASNQSPTAEAKTMFDLSFQANSLATQIGPRDSTTDERIGFRAEEEGVPSQPQKDGFPERRFLGAHDTTLRELSDKSRPPRDAERYEQVPPMKVEREKVFGKAVVKRKREALSASQHLHKAPRTDAGDRRQTLDDFRTSASSSVNKHAKPFAAGVFEPKARHTSLGSSDTDLPSNIVPFRHIKKHHVVEWKNILTRVIFLAQTEKIGSSNVRELETTLETIRANMDHPDFTVDLLAVLGLGDIKDLRHSAKGHFGMTVKMAAREIYAFWRSKFGDPIRV